MTTISAKIILDSINPYGNRLTTLECKYPRWIHAEGRTHRQLRMQESEPDGLGSYSIAHTGFGDEVRTPSLMEDPALSRNAASSRAIPVRRLIADIRRDPAVPLFWGSNQPGMQAGDECNNEVWIVQDGDFATTPMNRKDAWLEAMQSAIRFAEAFDKAGYHKQIVNRLIEPFMHITTLVSATEWSNFLALRIHEAAEPHIHLLAERIRQAMKNSVPQCLEVGEWHLPYVQGGEIDLDKCDSYGHAIDLARKLSTARCASVSYKTVDGQPMTLERAVELHDKLVAAKPLHASPAEHVAQVDERLDHLMSWANPQEHGNFVGFRQYRKMLPNECL